MKKTLLTVLGLTFIYAFATAQLYPPDGGHPSTIQWKQIDTDSVQIVFPEGMETQAQRITNTLHYIYKNDPNSLGDLTRKARILLQNQTTISNGFVFIAPFGSEFFSTAPQRSFLGTTNWLDALAIHEYRHIQQAQNAKVGLTQWAYNLSGESGWWGSAQFAIPSWFWEGDAVFQETALTDSGRGRLPEFFQDFRAFSNEKIKHSYNKVSAGSYKDVLPNHYRFGYLMTAYARNHFGNAVWQHACQDAARYQGIIYPFSRSLKRQTGLGTQEMYDAAVAELDSIFVVDNANFRGRKMETTLRNTLPKRNNPTFYTYPTFGEQKDLFAIKSSYEKTAHLVQIDETGKEKTQFFLGNNLNNYYSKKGNQLVYEEIQPHPRWSNQDFNNIVLYDLETQEKRYLTDKAKFFSPDLAFDQKQIIVAEVTPEMHNQLVIIDAQTGAEIQRIANPENYLISFPKWTSDNQSIVAVIQQNNQNALAQFDVATERMELLIPFSTFRITDLFIHDSWILFASHFTNQTQNIFAIKAKESTIYQLTNTKTNAAYPCVSPDGKTLAFVRRHADGNYIHSLAFVADSTQMLENLDLYAPVVGNAEYLNSNQRNILNTVSVSVSDTEHEVTDYKEKDNLFHLHSWIPKPFHPDYSILLESTNRLQTMGLSLEPSYNVNEKSSSIKASVDYRGLFPLLSVNFDNSFARSTGFFVFTDSSTNFASRVWDESLLGVSARVPLNLTKGRFSHFLQFSGRYNWANVRNQAEENELYDGNFHTARFDAVASNTQFQARKQAATRLGYYARLGVRTNINDVQQNQFLADAIIYLPGAAPTHGISVSGGFRSQGYNNTYKFSDNLAYPRGYGSFQGDRVYKVGINYRLPLLHPDWELGPFAFVKRFRSNLFFDYGVTAFKLNDRTIDFSYRSVGVELLTDVHWFRTADFPLGVRISYLLDKDLFNIDKAWNFGLIFSY